MDGNIGQHPPAVAWGRLPAFLGGMKFDCLVVVGVRCGHAAQLLGGVSKNVAMFIQARALHMALGPHARAPW
jgi:hypothetical protein